MGAAADPRSNGGAAGASSEAGAGAGAGGASSDAPAAASKRVVLLSWNVASWSTTLRLVKEHYGTLGCYLDRHGVDILCLQETKIQRGRVCESGLSGCDESGWESFWCCCRHATASKRGFNGVATFARKGLVRSACCDVFRDEALDSEGRCVAVDLGAFVLYNVYVPTSGERYARIPFKMKFLRTLRERMAESRAKGKRVILAGDLNIAPGAMDVHWRDRLVRLGEIEEKSATAGIAGGGRDPAQAPVPALSRVIAAIGGQGQIKKVRDWFGKIEVVGVPGKASQKLEQSSGGGNGSQQYARKEDSWRAVIREGKRETKIGKAFDRRGMAELRLGLKALQVSDEATGESFPVWPADHASVRHLGDVLKAMGQPLPDADLKVLADALGSSSYAPCLVTYFEELCAGDGMVDTFREGHGGARAPEGRFTCWDQRKNSRYSNEGVRIDFILVDGAMYGESVRREDYCLHGGCERVAEGSEEAALRMATAFGNFQPVPFTGGGMADPPMKAYDMQFVEPHNGIVYTPPKYSDHVGVSLMLHLKKGGKEWGGGEGDSAGEVSEARRRTLKTQPHLETKKISSFFQQGAAAKAAKGAAMGGQKRRPASGISLGGPPKRVAQPPAQKGGEGKKQKSLLSFMGKS